MPGGGGDLDRGIADGDAGPWTGQELAARERCDAAEGSQRAAWLYRQRSLLDAGLVLPGSSDRPVVSGAPLLGIHDMVNRRTASGAPFNLAEAITAAEALRAFTWGSAYASRQERAKGSIAPGRLADFAVLSEDPTVVAPDRIAGLEVVATFVDGNLRYAAASFAR